MRIVILALALCFTTASVIELSITVNDDNYLLIGRNVDCANRAVTSVNKMFTTHQWTITFDGNFNGSCEAPHLWFWGFFSWFVIIVTFMTK